MTYNDVLNFCEEQDVRFIRLSYFDMYGTQKNVSVLPTELKRAFVEGISFDASAIDGFLDEVHSDLFLYPDPNTMSILPWRSMDGSVIRMYCDIKYPDGTPFVLTLVQNLNSIYLSRMKMEKILMSHWIVRGIWIFRH